MKEQILTIIVSGRLWRNSLIMMDEETESYWSHITGSAIEGKYKGMRLQTVPAIQTTWADWVKEFPQTKVLKKDREIRSSQYEGYFSDPQKTGIFQTFWLQDRMHGKTLVFGLEHNHFALAITKKKLKKKVSFNPSSEKIESLLLKQPMVVGAALL